MPIPAEARTHAQNLLDFIIVASRLGIASVDVGSPMWVMQAAFAMEATK